MNKLALSNGDVGGSLRMGMEWRVVDGEARGGCWPRLSGTEGEQKSKS